MKRGVVCLLAVVSAAAYGQQPLVEVRGIPLDVRYATTDNFTKKKLYNEAACFLRPRTAEKLKAVSAELATSGYKLKIFDCYRPLSVQRKMWALVPDER